MDKRPFVLETPIKVVQFQLDRPWSFKAVPNQITEIPEGYCVIAPLVVTICASDRKYYQGQKSPEKLAKRLPMCLGHEATGRIAHSGHSTTFHLNDRVVIVPLNPCGECPACKRGKENLCSNAEFMASTCQGALQTAFCYPEHLLRPIPAFLDSDVASLIEPLSIGRRVVEDLKITEGTSVAIVGAGPMGSILALAVYWFGFNGKRNGGTLNLFDISDDSLAGVRRLGIADKTINMTEFPDDVMELRRSHHITLEAVGIQDTVQRAVDLSRLDGTVGMLGLFDGPIDIYGTDGKPLNIPVLTDFVNGGKRARLGKRTLAGCSRSRIKDYDYVLARLKQSPRLRELLHGLLSEDFFRIDSVEELKRAFEHARARAGSRKTTLHMYDDDLPKRPRTKLNV